MKQNLPKKVAIIYSGAKHSGGVETYLENLFENADRAKLDLTLLSLGEWPLTKKLASTKFRVECFSGIRINPITIYRIAKFLKLRHFDLVVSQGVVANLYARKSSFFSGVPSLVTVHSDSYYDYPNPIVRCIYGAVDRITRFPTKRYIAVSEYLKKKLVDSGIAEGKVTVILNGVKDPGLGSSAQPRNDGAIVIGSIGRLHKVKNYDALIEAFSKISNRDIELHIYGEGDERPKLEALINKLNLEDRVKLCGFDRDLGKIFADIDYYIQPSLMEGFGLTVVEAMLAGKPVIVTPVGSLKELVVDGETGIITAGTDSKSLVDAIEKFLGDKELAQKIGRSGARFAREEFSIDRWVSETENAFIEAAK